MSEPDLRCYYHSDREATSQCDRCGDYLCAECVNEHDELHVCAKCFEDIRPRDEIGESARIACVLNALVCCFWLLIRIKPPLPPSPLDTLAAISMTVSWLAVLLSLSDMRGRASEEQLFRWSIVTSASGSALVIAVVLLSRDATSNTGWMLMASSSLVLQVASVVLLGASAGKRAKPVWALIVALLAPVMFGAWLLLLLAGR